MKTLIVLILALTVVTTPAVVSAAPADQTCSTAPATDAVGQVTASGAGKENTRPFDLAGGAYTVRWSATSKAGPATLGNVILYLKRTDSVLGSDLLVNTTVSKESPSASGETQVYHVARGNYYLDVTSPGDWSVTVTPQ